MGMQQVIQQVYVAHAIAPFGEVFSKSDGGGLEVRRRKDEPMADSLPRHSTSGGVEPRDQCARAPGLTSIVKTLLSKSIGMGGLDTRYVGY